jgi:ketosteroid isomerase-like protein
MVRDDEEVVRDAYTAFNDRDIDRALALMDPEVAWPDVVNGGFVHGRDGVRRHWREVFASSRPRIELGGITRRQDASVVAEVRQVVTDPQGRVMSDDRQVHVFRIDGGLITRMDVEPVG